MLEKFSCLPANSISFKIKLTIDSFFPLFNSFEVFTLSDNFLEILKKNNQKVPHLKSLKTAFLIFYSYLFGILQESVLAKIDFFFIKNLEIKFKKDSRGYSKNLKLFLSIVPDFYLLKTTKIYFFCYKLRKIFLNFHFDEILIKLFKKIRIINKNYLDVIENFISIFFSTLSLKKLVSAKFFKTLKITTFSFSKIANVFKISLKIRNRFEFLQFFLYKKIPKKKTAGLIVKRRLIEVISNFFGVYFYKYWQLRIDNLLDQTCLKIEKKSSNYYKHLSFLVTTSTRIPQFLGFNDVYFKKKSQISFFFIFLNKTFCFSGRKKYRTLNFFLHQIQYYFKFIFRIPVQKNTDLLGNFKKNSIFYRIICDQFYNLLTIKSIRTSFKLSNSALFPEICSNIFFSIFSKITKHFNLNELDKLEFNRFFYFGKKGYFSRFFKKTEDKDKIYIKKKCNLLVNKSKIIYFYRAVRVSYLCNVSPEGIIFSPSKCFKDFNFIYQILFSTYKNLFRIFKLKTGAVFKKKLTMFLINFYFGELENKNYLCLYDFWSENFEFVYNCYFKFKNPFDFFKKFIQLFNTKTTLQAFLKFKNFLLNVFWSKKINFLFEVKKSSVFSDFFQVYFYKFGEFMRKNYRNWLNFGFYLIKKKNSDSLVVSNQIKIWIVKFAGKILHLYKYQWKKNFALKSKKILKTWRTTFFKEKYFL